MYIPIHNTSKSYISTKKQYIHPITPEAKYPIAYLYTSHFYLPEAPCPSTRPTS